MFEVNLRVLRYALAIADHGGFTQAAAALYLSQPPLSRQIKQLEQQLRVVLFERGPHGATVTPQGKLVLDAARAMLAGLDDAVAEAQAMQRSADRVLRVGFNATGGGPLATAARIAFEAAHPGIRVQPKRFDWGGEPAALREGLADVAFIWLPADLAGITHTVVATEPRIVGMSLQHKLAQRDALTLDDIRDEPLLWTRKAPREWVDWWAVNPRPDGSEPLWGPVNDNVEEMLEDAASGQGICISSAAKPQYYGRDDLAWRPLLGVEDLRIAVGWLTTNTDPLVAEYVKIVLAQTRRTAPKA